MALSFLADYFCPGSLLGNFTVGLSIYFLHSRNTHQVLEWGWGREATLESLRCD